jgi:hypothetical protein
MLDMRVRPCLSRLTASTPDMYASGHFHLHCHTTQAEAGTVTQWQTRSSHNLQHRGAAAAPPDNADLIPLSAKKKNQHTHLFGERAVPVGPLRLPVPVREPQRGTHRQAHWHFRIRENRFHNFHLLVVMQAESLTDANPSLHRLLAA